MVLRVRKSTLSEIRQCIFVLNRQLKLAEPTAHINEQAELFVFGIDRTVKAVDIDNFVSYHVAQIRRPVRLVGKGLEIIARTLCRKV